jgi:hypothetical protein
VQSAVRHRTGTRQTLGRASSDARRRLVWHRTADGQRPAGAAPGCRRELAGHGPEGQPGLSGASAAPRWGVVRLGSGRQQTLRGELPYIKPAVARHRAATAGYYSESYPARGDIVRPASLHGGRRLSLTSPSTLISPRTPILFNAGLADTHSAKVASGRSDALRGPSTALLEIRFSTLISASRRFGLHAGLVESYPAKVAANVR